MPIHINLLILITMDGLSKVLIVGKIGQKVYKNNFNTKSEKKIKSYAEQNTGDQILAHTELKWSVHFKSDMSSSKYARYIKDKMSGSNYIHRFQVVRKLCAGQGGWARKQPRPHYPSVNAILLPSGLSV